MGEWKWRGSGDQEQQREHLDETRPVLSVARRGRRATGTVQSIYKVYVTYLTPPSRAHDWPAAITQFRLGRSQWQLRLGARREDERTRRTLIRKMLIKG